MISTYTVLDTRSVIWSETTTIIVVLMPLLQQTSQKKNTINDIMNKASAPTSPANYAEILKAIKDDLPKLSQGEYKVIKL